LGIHKFFGTLIFSLVVLRFIWKYIFNTHPKYENIPLFHKVISNIVHFILYALVILIPIQGTYMTWLGGGDVYLLGIYKISPLIEMDFILYPKALTLHYYSALTLTGLFSLHILAALYHRLIIKDKYGVWNRMVFKRRKV
jgi:Cytochrome B561